MTSYYRPTRLVTEGDAVISRRSVQLAGSIALLAAHRLPLGQPSETLRRVGWLSIGSEASTAHLYAAFVQGMRDLGWQQGTRFETRMVYANGDVSRLYPLATQLIAQKVEVIMLGAAAAAHAALRATKTTPIVMAGVADAVGAGFVASLAKPGGNITGVTAQQTEVLGKLVEILRDVAPGARRVAIMLNAANPVHPTYWAAAQSACASFDLTAVRIVASAPEDFGAAVEEIIRQRSQAVVVVPDAIYQNARVKLQQHMEVARLPVGYGWREHVIAGGLLSYGTDLAATYRHVAAYVDKILKGAKPADLPVEQPTKFELVINLQTAKALGLTIPQAMLLRADEVIQ